MSKDTTMYTFMFGQIAQMLLLLSPAIAVMREVDTTFVSLRQAERAAQQESQVKINGALACPLAAENTGEGCNLTLRDSRTGRTYRLSNANGAMRLYQNGTKNVTIEGTLADGQTIQVATAQATETTN